MAKLRARNAISGAGWVAWVQSVRLARPGGLVDSVRVVDRTCGSIAYAVGEARCAQRGEISAQHSGSRNGGGVRRSRALPVLLPADVKESLVLYHWPAELQPILVLRPGRRLVLQAVFQLELLVEVFVGVQHLVAEVFICGTVPVIRARLRAQVYYATRELAPFGALIVSLDFVLANRILGRNNDR